MLYLPLGIRNYLEAIAMKRATNMGSFLIELVCKTAWSMGFKCDHPENMRQYNKKHRTHICKICGMQFERDKTGRWENLGYPLVDYIK